MPSPELLLDRRRLQSARCEEDVAVEPEVGQLLDESLVGLGDGGQGGLDALLSDLACGGGRSCLDQSGHVRARRAGESPLRDDPPEPRREAGLGARVARRAVRSHAIEERVSVAVVANLLDGHRVPRGGALVPELPAGAAPEPGLAALPRPAQRLVVRVREHQDTVRVRVLDDHGRQRLIGHPASSSSAFSSGSRSGRSWTIEAIRAASAPTSNASAMCRASPAPPDAITGTSTAAATLRVSSRSYPARVPSASIDVRRISPAPRSTASRAHSTAALSRGLRPAWVTTSPARASIAQTTACEPNSAASEVRIPGSSKAARLMATLSAPASSRSRASSTPVTPPPAVKGIVSSSAARPITSRIGPRPSSVAVMSRKTSSSAPSSE